ncbi:iron-containing alcohol dehydrogenase [Ancrocorticia populi]|uniref:Alcohol dehydrogenase n=1 Tax=Ancrocorticia populi TaxID=2175228 RepID=A0A2V1K7B6_9ACTO|nr:iron-containing alcohol dehydrogenase [Ancrocorticia populi]MDN6486966.1 iron-containing alcohol dehydrogenase [Ancrocorticia sp.]PWF27358.1 alcohol dehydrogenase [Ancrocorticia populi]
MSFNFATAGRIAFGDGTSEQLLEEVKAFGDRAFVITGNHTDADESPLATLKELPGLEIWRTTGEPSVEGVRAATAAAREANPDVIVALGGGSVIDTAKSVGILLRNDGDLMDYLEVVGRGQKLAARTVPVVALPTTSGTGAEVTANAPIYSPEHKLKASLRSPAMIPAVAIVDPNLTLSCPPAVTASSGLDALTQCIEPFTSGQANAFTDILSQEGLRRTATGLRAAYADGSNRAAREDMAFASLLGGLSLANAKLGAAHGIAAPVGGLTGAPHGNVCAAVLAQCCETNIKAMKERDPENPAIARYDTVGQLLTGNPEATAEDGTAWIRETVAMLGVGGLASLGLTEARLDAATKGAMNASSMKGNPIVLTYEEVHAILTASL